MSGEIATRSWVEITDASPATQRLDLLAAAIREVGIENSARVIETDDAGFDEALSTARAEGVSSFRIAGGLQETVLNRFTSLPSQMLALKTVDALTLEQDGRLWPRNLLSGALLRLVATDLKHLDLRGTAFIVGATPAAWAVSTALSSAGFNRINLTDEDDERGLALVEQLGKCNFKVQFEFSRRSQITQLAGTHSIAVNTLSIEESSRLSELFYFNFLKAGGAWMEVSLGPQNTPLIHEASSVGAEIVTSARVAAFHDVAWAEAALDVRLQPDSLSSTYAQAFGGNEQNSDQSRVP